MGDGYCLSSQEIRFLIDQGNLVTVDENLESRVQPSSFEPVIGDEVFVLDAEPEGLFRVPENETVYKTLLQLPKKQRQKMSTTDGFEIKVGHSYLFPLEERVKLPPGTRIKASPKSSCGRLFINSRLVADFNMAFDEVYNVTEDPIQLWLLVQPLAFNCIVKPGLCLNQIRFLYGTNFMLSEAEVAKEYETNPFLFLLDENGNLAPKEPMLFEGPRVTLDISGNITSGIAGLLARHNPCPIDLSKKKELDAEDYFSPITAKDGMIRVEPKQHCLLASKEFICMPHHLNSELRDHSHVGINGPLHFAGFIDNGFNGQIVFEIRSDEITTVVLRDKMQISTLNLYRCNATPDKIYGEKIGSHYFEQVGVRPAKHFKKFDFKRAGKDYSKLDRSVLVEDARTLLCLRKEEEGFELIPQEDQEKRSLVERVAEGGFFQSRYDCEDDDLILQPIPYVVIFGKDNTVFSYVRASDIRDYGDKRLFGKHSIGVGGHVRESDGPDLLKKSIQREVFEEELCFTAGEASEPVLVGTLFSRAKPVDRVHFGLIYVIKTEGDVKPKESSFVSGNLRPISEVQAENMEMYETWSRMIIPHLNELKDSAGKA
jgi:dCTP deaminase